MKVYTVSKSHLSQYTKILAKFKVKYFGNNTYVETYITEDSNVEGCPVYIIQRRDRRHGVIDVILLGYKENLNSIGGLLLNGRPEENSSLGWGIQFIDMIPVYTSSYSYPIAVAEIRHPAWKTMALLQRRRHDQTSTAVLNNEIVLSTDSNETKVLINMFVSIIKQYSNTNPRNNSNTSRILRVEEDVIMEEEEEEEERDIDEIPGRHIYTSSTINSIGGINLR